MVIAERLESERLRQTIREFQRHRFGRRGAGIGNQVFKLSNDLRYGWQLEQESHERTASQERGPGLIGSSRNGDEE